MVYEPFKNVNIYASYSDLYVPQTERKADGSMLDPRTGSQYEIGVKTSFWDNRLAVNVAGFYINDNGRAYKVNPAENTYINGGLVENKGVDVEINAYPYKGLEFMTSYTFLDTHITKSSSGDEGLAFSPVEPKPGRIIFPSELNAYRPTGIASPLGKVFPVTLAAFRYTVVFRAILCPSVMK